MMKLIYIFAALIALPAYAGNWATFNSSGNCTGWGTEPDTVAPGNDTGQPNAITINTPPGAVPITNEELEAAPNLSLSNGTVTIISSQTPIGPSTIAVQAQNAMNAGIVITSTSTPSLNGTYSISSDAQSNVNGIETYILANGNFPGNASTYAYLDQSGVPHVFPNTQEFKAFATAVANLVSALKTVELTNSGTLPSSSVTIP